VQHERKQLEKADYERLKRFIDHAVECGLIFNDLNALYNYFIQESTRERFTNSLRTKQESQHSAQARAESENVIMPSTSSVASAVQRDEQDANSDAGKIPSQEAEVSTAASQPLPLPTTSSASSSKASATAGDSKNVVSIFGESGIEVDNKLLDAKVSERMILGLVDKSQSDGDNISDVVSSNASMSSLSNAETVKINQKQQQQQQQEDDDLKKEKDTQTTSYADRIREKRQQRQYDEKSKSASSIKSLNCRQPFTCKIPILPGIGRRLNDEKIKNVIEFLIHRSCDQGGYIFPRNLLEKECPSLM
jgi:hypothetical protein